MLWLLLASPGSADSYTVAVASNFARFAEGLVRDYDAASGNRGQLVVASTGLLYAQLLSGAPYDVYLAADMVRPQELAKQGLAQADSLFVYALGKLVLWVPGAAAPPPLSALANPDLHPIAIAHPELAPYGAVAGEVLDAEMLVPEQGEAIVQAQNVAGVFAMVASGNARSGLLALAHMLQEDIPPEEYLAIDRAIAPWIPQGAVLTRHGQHNAAGRGFLNLLKSDSVQAQLSAAGYGVPGLDQ